MPNILNYIRGMQGCKVQYIQSNSQNHLELLTQSINQSINQVNQSDRLFRAAYKEQGS